MKPLSERKNASVFDVSPVASSVSNSVWTVSSTDISVRSWFARVSSTVASGTVRVWMCGGLSRLSVSETAAFGT